MSPSRRLLPLWLLVAPLLACASDSTDRGGADAGDMMGTLLDGSASDRDAADEPGGDGDGDGDGDTQPGDGDGDEANDACIPLGCEEQGFECGAAEDGCGGPLDCDPSVGPACEGFDYCGGDPDKGANKCGCKPSTCEELGAACGSDVPDGCGGSIESCGHGDCSEQGATYACAADRSACQCMPLSINDVCAGRACNAYSNGCDATIDCGSCSAFKKCVEGDDDTSSCACDDSQAKRQQACGSATCGTVTTADGCTYGCGPACAGTCASGGACGGSASCTCPVNGPGTADDEVCFNGACCRRLTQAEACGTQTCGTASDGCGGSVQCGTCASGQECASPLYNLDAAKETCLPRATARLLGKYLVRAHAFRNSESILGTKLNRSESISIVTIERSGGQLRLRDLGCVTSSIDENGENPSLAPSYFNLPELVVSVSASAGVGGQPDTWLRPYHTEAAGFIDSRPQNYYCSAAGVLTNPNAPDFDAIASDLNSEVTPASGANKPWLAPNNNPCTCPASGADYGAFPAGNTSASLTGVKDCRIYDLDEDGLPGFTVVAESPGLFGSKIRVTATAVSLSTTMWKGNVAANGRHTGVGAISEDRSTPVSRRILSCSSTTSLACSNINNVVDWSCGQSYDLIQFVRLTSSDLNLKCSDFYKVAQPDSVDDVDQSAINSRFGAISGTTCSTNAQCGASEVCRGGTCWPKTTPGACAGGVSCGEGWTCKSKDNACWPASCPDPKP